MTRGPKAPTGPTMSPDELEEEKKRLAEIARKAEEAKAAAEAGKEGGEATTEEGVEDEERPFTPAEKAKATRELKAKKAELADAEAKAEKRKKEIGIELAKLEDEKKNPFKYELLRRASANHAVLFEGKEWKDVTVEDINKLFTDVKGTIHEDGKNGEVHECDPKPENKDAVAYTSNGGYVKKITGGDNYKDDKTATFQIVGPDGTEKGGVITGYDDAVVKMQEKAGEYQEKVINEFHDEMEKDKPKKLVEILERIEKEKKTLNKEKKIVGKEIPALKKEVEELTLKRKEMDSPREKKNKEEREKTPEDDKIKDRTTPEAKAKEKEIKDLFDKYNDIKKNEKNYPDKKHYAGVLAKAEKDYKEAKDGYTNTLETETAKDFIVSEYEYRNTQELSKMGRIGRSITNFIGKFDRWGEVKEGEKDSVGKWSARMSKRLFSTAVVTGGSYLMNPSAATSNYGLRLLASFGGGAIIEKIPPKHRKTVGIIIALGGASAMALTAGGGFVGAATAVGVGAGGMAAGYGFGRVMSYIGRKTHKAFGLGEKVLSEAEIAEKEKALKAQINLEKLEEFEKAAQELLKQASGSRAMRTIEKTATIALTSVTVTIAAHELQQHLGDHDSVSKDGTPKGHHNLTKPPSGPGGGDEDLQPPGGPASPHAPEAPDTIKGPHIAVGHGDGLSQTAQKLMNAYENDANVPQAFKDAIGHHINAYKWSEAMDDVGAFNDGSFEMHPGDELGFEDGKLVLLRDGHQYTIATGVDSDGHLIKGDWLKEIHDAKFVHTGHDRVVHEGSHHTTGTHGYEEPTFVGNDSEYDEPTFVQPENAGLTEHGPETSAAQFLKDGLDGKLTGTEEAYYKMLVHDAQPLIGKHGLMALDKIPDKMTIKEYAELVEKAQNLEHNAILEQREKAAREAAREREAAHERGIEEENIRLNNLKFTVTNVRNQVFENNEKGWEKINDEDASNFLERRHIFSRDSRELVAVMHKYQEVLKGEGVNVELNPQSSTRVDTYLTKLISALIQEGKDPKAIASEVLSGSKVNNITSNSDDTYK